jgi:IMP dehydrogenase
VAEVEIGAGKSARRAYGLEEISIVPTRRTRDPEDVDISFQLDAYHFALPVIAAPLDGVVSPEVAVRLGELGGLAALNLEGLWTRYEDPLPLLEEIAGLDAERATPRLQELYSAPLQPDLLRQRIREIAATGAVTCGALTPQRAADLAPVILDAELDVLIIHGTVVSAEHVSKRVEPLNLKKFIRELDIPVVVGGCSSYQAALHLMRTGAVGILVGLAPGGASTTRDVLGIDVPAATAIADVVGARSRHLEETGVYVQVIADTGLGGGADLVKAVACGADAVMLGGALAAATGAPGHGRYWGTGAAHATLPRGTTLAVEGTGDLETVLLGPAHEGGGRTNLCGALRRAMAMCGYASIREFHKAEIVIGAPGAEREPARSDPAIH